MGGGRRPQPFARDVGDCRDPTRVVPSGTLLALGCALGGWSLHVLDGRLRYLHNLHGLRLYEVVTDSRLGPGRHHLEFRFEEQKGAGGLAALLVDGQWAGRPRWSVSPRSRSTRSGSG